MRTSVLLLAVLCGPMRFVAAQQPREFGTAAWLAKPVSISASSVGRVCAILPHEETYNRPPQRSDCRVVRVVSLGQVADRAWSYALYRHVSVYRFPEASQPDTVTELELVLFSAQRQDARRLAAIAHTRQDYTGIANMSMMLAGQPTGLLLGVQFCINGTAGCWQEFVRRIGAQWQELADPRELLATALQRTGVLRDSTGARLAPPHVDLNTLRGSAALYSRTDANCCPARRVDFQLELTGAGFRLVTFAVVPDSL